MVRIFLFFLINISIYADTNITYSATANAETLGLYYQDYNFLMGLTGLLIGFLFSMAVVLLTINMGKR